MNIDYADSYAVTRIHVMRTKLIKSDEYDRLLKMSDKEVINYLQSTEYREDVDALAIKDLEDLESVDKILSHHDDRIMRKLERIASKQFKQLLHSVLMRNDLWNIMVVAEAIAGENDTKDAVTRYGRRGTLDAMQFAKAKTIKDLWAIAGEFVPDLGEEPTDFAHAMSMLASRRSIAEKNGTGKKNSSLYLAADQLFIDERNLANIVRLKREDVAPAAIVNMLLLSGTINMDLLRKAARDVSVKDALTTLRQTSYKDVIDRALETLKEESLVRFENDVHKEVVTRIRKLTRRNPLGIEVLIH